jgi:hypothetical protein
VRLPDTITSANNDRPFDVSPAGRTREPLTDEADRTVDDNIIVDADTFAAETEEACNCPSTVSGISIIYLVKSFNTLCTNKQST